ncbi:MAG: hypothetical protein HY360_07720 [Verrucomicrobia bacterium]|nr:hypothetical protein [Verrucomicrobiota bacterium]
MIIWLILIFAAWSFVSLWRSGHPRHSSHFNDGNRYCYTTGVVERVMGSAMVAFVLSAAVCCPIMLAVRGSPKPGDDRADPLGYMFGVVFVAVLALREFRVRRVLKDMNTSLLCHPTQLKLDSDDTAQRLGFLDLRDFNGYSKYHQYATSPAMATKRPVMIRYLARECEDNQWTESDLRRWYGYLQSVSQYSTLVPYVPEEETKVDLTPQQAQEFSDANLNRLADLGKTQLK